MLCGEEPGCRRYSWGEGETGPHARHCYLFSQCRQDQRPEPGWRSGPPLCNRNTPDTSFHTFLRAS